MRCQAELVATMPPGFEDAEPGQCPNTSEWRVVTAWSNDTFCPIHTAGEVTRLLNNPDINSIVLISAIDE